MLSTPAIAEVVPLARSVVAERQDKDTFHAGQNKKVYKICWPNTFFLVKHLKLYCFLTVIAKLKSEQMFFGFWASESSQWFYQATVK